MRKDHRIDLLRSVGDDSPWYEKALFHAITALEEIDEGGPHVNHVQHVAARGLENVERELAEYEPHV
jgi:hypothetical protein